MSKYISEEIKNKIGEMYRENKVPVYKIANEFGVNVVTVNNIRCDYGIPARLKEVPEENILMAVEMYEEGYSNLDIYNATRVGSRVLYSEIDSRNISRRRKQYQHSAGWLEKENPKYKKILALFEMGKSRREISVELDVSYSLVANLIRKELKNKNSMHRSCHMEKN